VVAVESQINVSSLFLRVADRRDARVLDRHPGVETRHDRLVQAGAINQAVCCLFRRLYSGGGDVIPTGITAEEARYYDRAAERQMTNARQAWTIVDARPWYARRG